jgi:hypothetical protein
MGFASGSEPDPILIEKFPTVVYSLARRDPAR